jgi:hypothetical protein
MPELSRVLTCTCPSNISWSHKVKGSNGSVHLVTFNQREGYRCTCEGFRYRKTCKHVNDPDILKNQCGWGIDAFCNHIYTEKVCPDCGAETIPFYVGV